MSDTIPVGSRNSTLDQVAAQKAATANSQAEVVDHILTKIYPLLEQPEDDRITIGAARVKAQSAWAKEKAARKKAAADAKEDQIPIAVAAAQIAQDHPTATDKGGQLWRYNDSTGHWTTEDAPQTVRRAARLIYTDERYLPSIGDAIVKILLDDKATIDPSRNTWRVALRNGTLNLTKPAKPKLEEHSPGNRLTATLPVAYDKNATCPTWDRYLAEAIPEPLQRTLLQQCVGTMLVDQTPPKGAIIWIGPQDTGKTQGINTIKALLGPENVSSLSPQKLAKSEHASAAIFGKKANIPSDIPVDAWKDPSEWKQLVGQDWLYANPKYKDIFAFLPTATNLMTGNKMPATYDRTGAVRSRLFVIHGRTDTIPMDERDPHLLKKLTAELPGILNWAIKGLTLVWENGWLWDIPDQALAEQHQLHRLDNPYLLWIEDHCTEQEGEFLRTSEAAHSYQEWLQRHQYLSPGDDEKSIPAQQLTKDDRTRLFQNLDELWGTRVHRGHKGGLGWLNRQLHI